jgi:subtilisin family serine protease
MLQLRRSSLSHSFALLAIALLLDGGGAWAADMTRQQALSALPTHAASKVDAQFLIRLLDQGSNDVVVEFVQNGVVSLPSTDRATALQSAKAAFLKTKQQVVGSLASGGYEQLRDYDALPMTFARLKNRRALVQLLSHESVKAVHENTPHTHTLLQSLPLIRQPQAISTGRQGGNTTVAVLDTGVEYTRTAFGSCSAPGVPAGCRVVAALDMAPNDGALDDNGHGTNVAGIVAATAPATRIAALDVFTGDSAFPSDIIAGINWAINNGPQYAIVAMNLSLGRRGAKFVNECPESWAAAPFANARAAGIVPVVAAGNDGFTDGVAEPACAPGAVRVGAVYDANVGSVSFSDCSDAATAADKVTCFSNNGSLLTLLAPGGPITAAGITMYGTSQAAPHVAGAIAILRAEDAAAADSIDQTVDRLTNTGNVVVDHRNGLQKPRVDLYSAVSGIATPPLSEVILLLEDD